MTSVFKSTAMTSRDYERIAGVFKAQLHAMDSLLDPITNPGILTESHHPVPVARKTLVYAAIAMAHTLAASDPGFKQTRFLQACGLASADISPDYCASCQHPKHRHLPVAGWPEFAVACDVLLCECNTYTPGLGS